MVESKFLREDGGMTRRVLTTLEQFHAKYGAWPSRLTMDGFSLGALIQYGLTPLGFYRLQLRVEILVEDIEGRPLYASDSDGRECDYMEVGVERPESGPSAADWLGFGVNTK